MSSDPTELLLEYIFTLLQTHDYLLVILAIIGIFAIAKAILQTCGTVFVDMFRLFVITPVIFISAIFDARKDSAKRNELTEIKNYIKTNPNVLKSTIIWFGFLLIVAVLVYQFMFKPEIEMMYTTGEITTTLINNTT